jgi:Ca-activated chloride channel family protein
VAVDNQVRNQNGRPATVKQPLPLPQGVSDYAVGGMKLSQAPASLMARKEAPAEFADKPPQEQRWREKDKGTVSLGEVNVSEGLSKEAVLKVIRKKMVELKYSAVKNETGGKLVLSLTINPKGKVKYVQIVSSSLKDTRWQQDIIEQMKKWRFPTTQGNQEAKVTISLVFGAQ